MRLCGSSDFHFLFIFLVNYLFPKKKKPWPKVVLSCDVRYFIKAGVYPNLSEILGSFKEGSKSKKKPLDHH